MDSLEILVSDIIREHGLESDKHCFEGLRGSVHDWISKVYVQYPFGFSWQVTDALGQKFCPDDRSAGHLLYFLSSKIVQEGHTCYPLSLLYGAMTLNFGPVVRSKDELEAAIRKLIDLGKVVVRHKAIWAQSTYMDEAQILSGIREAASRKPDLDLPLEAYTSGLTEKQAEALRLLVKSRVLILDGLPGTGKTHLSAKIAEYLEAEGYDITLLAPTGLAAKNLKDRCKRHASTIHSFVMSRKNQERDLQGRQAFLIDEFSMVETRILAEFFELIQHCVPYLIFVGDTNQLPSVGPGNLLSEIISLKDQMNLSYVQLTQIIRQKTGSEIAQNASLIRGGSTNLINKSEYNFFEMNETDIPQMILRSAEKMKAENRDFVVLSAIKRGPCGIDSLNEVLRGIFNGPSPHKREVKEFREGDRILVNRNFYDFGLVNGDIGYIKEIQSPQKFLITVIDKEYVINQEVISCLKHAYAQTIHKSQGREFDTVLMPFVDSFGVMLRNRLLYTAITRAKRKCVVFGSSSAIVRAIKNTKDQDRFTGLRLIETGKPSWGRS